MATRDLTKKFVELRTQHRATRPRPTHSPKDSALSVSNASSVPGDAHLLGNARDLEKGGGPDWAAARSQLPPKWVDVVDKVDDLVKSIEGQMKELSALHRKRLLVSFDDSAEGRKEKEIEAHTGAITDLFREAEKLLAGVAKQQGDESDSELKVRRNLQRSLAFKIQKLSNTFRGQQKEYLGKLRAQKEGTLGQEQFAFLNKADTDVITIKDSASDTGFTQAQVAVVDNIDMIVNERDQEIQRIAQSIEELAHVMKHLADLVIDQGTILDRIDYNMDQAVEHVQEGVHQLEETEKIQKQGGPFKCILALLVLIFILVLVNVGKHMPRRRKGVL